MALLNNWQTGDDEPDMFDEKPDWPRLPEDRVGDKRKGLTSEELSYCDRVAENQQRRRR